MLRVHSWNQSVLSNKSQFIGQGTFDGIRQTSQDTVITAPCCQVSLNHSYWILLTGA